MGSATNNSLANLREQLKLNQVGLAGLYGNSPVMLALRQSYEWNNSRLEKEIAELQSKQSPAGMS